jgi:RNA polymerase sigma factor (sigma-70 family)
MPRKQDPFTDAYRNKILSHPILPEEEIQELILKAQNGDTEARQRVISHNYRLVWSNAQWFKKKTREHSLFDLFQAGIPALDIAITKFNPKKGAKFNTYATWWIRQRIKTYVRTVSGWTRVPSNQMDEYYKLRKQLRERLHREPSDMEIERHLVWLDRMVCKKRKKNTKGHRISGKTFKHNLATHRALVPSSKKSLDSPRKGDPESGSYLLELLIGNRDGVGRNLEIESRSETLTNFLKQLPQRERDILEMRFGLDGGEPLTLEKIGERLHHLTRERIRQLEAKMIRELRFLIIRHLLSEPGYRLREVLEDEEYVVLDLLFGSKEKPDCLPPKKVAEVLGMSATQISKISDRAMAKIHNSLS